MEFNQWMTKSNILNRPRIEPYQIQGQITRSESLSVNALRVKLLDERRIALGSVAAGALKTIKLQLQTQPALSALPLLLIELYRDNDLTETDAWPEPDVRVEWVQNVHLSNPDSGLFIWNVRVKNEDSGSHTFFFYYSVLVPLAIRGVWTETVS
jgi:hypothetical protein